MVPLKSWLPVPPSSPFSLHNLPLGIITHTSASTPHPAIAIGDHALDLAIFTAQSGFRCCSPLQPHSTVFSSPTLNALAALGRPIHAILRKYIQSIFLLNGPYPDLLQNNEVFRKECLIPLSEVTCHLPMQIGDYTDFFAGLHHAHRCGVIFRGEANALSPNYYHLPVAYHGRASSVVVAGTSITRPKGQILAEPAAEVKTPIFSPSKWLDYELELGCFLCKSTSQGESIPVDKAHEYLFGVALLNDWSARDFQSWEAIPLGPFTAKNFATSISPWIVMMDALEPFRISGIPNEVEPLDYLRESEKKNVYDMRLSVSVAPQSAQSTTTTRTNGKNLLWSFSQMLAHHTAGGCNVNVGDLLGSGTISGTDDGTCGSLLESTKGGKKKIKFEGGKERLFLEDGDTVRFEGVCGEEGALVGWGECVGKVLPAKT